MKSVVQLHVSILAPMMGVECKVSNMLNTMMLLGRQLLKLPNFPVQVGMLVCPELVGSWANRCPSA